MSVPRVISGSVADGRRGLVYGGGLIVSKKVPPTETLCAYVDGMIREVFETGDPVRAQFGIDSHGYISRAEALQGRYREDDAVRELLLGRVGVDLGRTFRDPLYLRVSPNDGEHAGRRTAPLGFHRVAPNLDGRAARVGDGAPLPASLAEG